MVQVEEKRLAELLRDELELNALETGGVEYWENYDNSLLRYINEDIDYMSDEDIIKNYL